LALDRLSRDQQRRLHIADGAWLRCPGPRCQRAGGGGVCPRVRRLHAVAASRGAAHRHDMSSTPIDTDRSTSAMAHARPDLAAPALEGTVAAARQLAQLFAEARAAVAFTGAGVSTESGIPDFRSPDGVWARFDPREFTYQNFMGSHEGRRRYWTLGRVTYPIIRAAA